MRYVPPRPHSQRLSKPAGFWFLLLLRLLLFFLLLLVFVIHHGVPLYHFLFSYFLPPLALHGCLISSFFVCLCRCVVIQEKKNVNEKQHSIHIRTLAAGRRERSGGGAAGAGLFLHDARHMMCSISAVNTTEQEGGKKNKKKQQNKNYYPFPTPSPITAKNMFPYSWKICKKTTGRLSSPPRFAFSVCSFLFLFSLVLPPLCLGPTLVWFPSRARQLLARAGWLSDTVTLTELSHVTALLAEHLTWHS